MNSKNLEIVDEPKLLEKIVISKYDDGTTTQEICAEGAHTNRCAKIIISL